MKIVGILAEYNPFHNGHLYHLEQTKTMGATHTVCLLGGHFTQRGETSVMSKWAKAKVALEYGADLVLELPHLFSISPAPDYAKYAVNVFNALNCVDAMSFGCEAQNSREILSLYEKVTKFDSSISKVMKEEKCGYPAAREMVLRQNGFEKEAEEIKKPNNILGIEYISAINELNSNLDIMTVKRKIKHNSDQTDNSICSASKIRELIVQNKNCFREYMPKAAVDILTKETKKGFAPVFIERIQHEILSRLRMLKKSDFENLPWISEGLHNKIFDTVKNCSSIDEIVEICTTNRYTSSRIRRILIAAATGIEKSDVRNLISPPYIRVLGTNEKGREILRLAKDRCTVPLISRSSDILNSDARPIRLFEIENTATDLYTMGFSPIGKCSMELTENIYSK